MGIKKLRTAIYKLLGSDAFFYATVLFLVLSALWIALSVAYPLPFDEYYHFGIIKIYTDQWSPFISVQPPEASLYGDITRYPSYLYHYLMSFPLRLMSIFTHSEPVQIIVLRLLNIAMAASGLVVFRRVLLRLWPSKPAAHLSLLFVALTPIVAFVAAHINYDNLLFLMTPWMLLLALKIVQRGKVSAKHVLLFVSIGLLSCIVKYPMAIIFGALAAYVFVVLLRRDGLNLPKKLLDSLQSYNKSVQIGLLILIILSAGLMIERFGINLARYHQAVPACEIVQSEAVCMHYTPWLRNYNYAKQPHANQPLSEAVPEFTNGWLAKIIEGFYAPFSHLPGGPKSAADPFGPLDLQPLLPVQRAVAWIVAVGVGLCLLFYSPRLFKERRLRLVIVLALIYLVVLWLKNFSNYLEFGRLVAVQARYLLPLLPVLFLLGIKLVSYVVKTRSQRLWLATIVFIVYLQGAGAGTYILRSQPGWYWKHRAVSSANQVAKKLIGPFTFE